MIVLRALLVSLALVAFPLAPATADQSDPRLDSLFARLKSVPDVEAARPVERDIWRIWYTHDDPEVERIMRGGRENFAHGDRVAARMAFGRALSLDPEYAEAWNARATAHYVLGDCERALEDIAETLALEPRHFGALAGKGLCLERQDDPAGALRAYERSLAIHPHQPQTQARARALAELLRDREI